MRTARRTAGNCSPMSMNTNALMSQMTVCHTPAPISRASGERTRAARWPVMSPATTVARTPDMPTCSAAR